jgi:hypothetical protein
LAMEENRRRLERTQLKIYAALLVLLFGGLLILPWIGQVIWIAFIMAIYIRLIVVITRKEELLEKLHPRRKTKRTAWYEVRERRSAITDYSDGAWPLGVDSNCDRKPIETRRLLSSSSSDRFGSDDEACER